jgi:hypothetical protein
MTPGLRKFVLTAHVTFSVGWLGSVVSFLVLAVIGLMSTEDQIVRAAYVAMELITWFVIVPLAVASLVSGLVQSLGTNWGLFRHHWIIAKFLITIVATILLMVHTRPIGILAGASKEVLIPISDYRGLQIQLIGDAIAAIVLLLAATTLSVYKPFGLTAYGRRKQAESRSDVSVESDVDSDVKPLERFFRRPRWVYILGIHAIGLMLLFIVLHLTGRGLPGH